MDQRPEPIAPQGLHEKVMELVAGLSGTDVLDAPTGYGALTEKLLAAGKNVTVGDIDLARLVMSDAVYYGECLVVLAAKPR